MGSTAIVFSKDNYAIKISYIRKKIKSFHSDVEIKIINNYEIFIKPAEINSLYKIFGISKKPQMIIRIDR